MVFHLFVLLSLVGIFNFVVRLKFKIACDNFNA